MTEAVLPRFLQSLTITNLSVGKSRINLALSRSEGSVLAKFIADNDGGTTPVALR